MNIFTPSVAGQSDSVIVIAGGPSARTNIDRVKEYSAKNGSRILAANYHYRIEVDYTYFGDGNKFSEQIKNIKSNVVVSNKIARIASKFSKRIRNGQHLFKVQTNSSGPGIYASNSVEFSDDGSFPYNGIGTSGLACLALSVFFKPLSILMVGFDGPVPDASVKMRFDGSSVCYGKPKKMQKEMKYLKNSLFPSLSKRGIKLYTFDDVKFYGIDKSKLGLIVI